MFPIKIADSLNLDLKDGESAFSKNYNDIYFQPNIGLEEKRHVFLEGNNLPKSWINKDSFTIAETGFGTGLNFIATMQLWHNTRNTNQHLHYVSCELHPLNRKQLHQALSHFSELDNYSQQLLAQYPSHLFYGFHQIFFRKYNITLTLIIGDCVDAFEQLNADIDAWYLDGFAPSKNQKMWSPRLFKAIANLSHSGTTAATYTVARAIRDNLTQVGFEINKSKGFGQKREMLCAHMVEQHKTIINQPWQQTFKAKKNIRFTVLGAGIAGTSIVDKLTSLCKNVTLIDRHTRPCQETSGNPQAMVMPSLTINDSIEAQFYLSAFLYAKSYYKQKNFHTCGVYELAFTEQLKNWQEKLLNLFNFPEEIVKQYKKGILYPTAGWLDTQAHAKIVFNTLDNYLQAQVSRIEYVDNQWQMYEDNKLIHTTDVLILANGINILKLLPKYELPIKPKHGQISYFKSENSNPKIANCRPIQLHKGYITPNKNGIQTIGATYDHIKHDDWHEPPKTSKDHWQRNTELWQDTPYAEMLRNISSHEARAGIRITTPDHLPICGAIIEQQQFKKDYHDICHGKHWIKYPAPKPVNNLYLLTGLGSRGFTSAPLLAEFLCNQILGMPHALPQQLQQAINPNRFLFKQLKKQ